MQRVAVIGAGVVGLSAALALREAGHVVRCFDPTPGAHRSAGTTRIFRRAHRDPALVEAAIEALGLWREWERRWERRLVGHETALVGGERDVSEFASAMRIAGAEPPVLDAATAATHLSIARLEGALLLDAAGGVIRAERSMALLLQEIGADLHRASVVHIDAATTTVHTDAEVWPSDHVVVCAGVSTPVVCGDGDIADTTAHSRFDFRMRPGVSPHQACLLDGRGGDIYAQPVGTTGRYAIGWEGAVIHDPEAASLAGRAALTRYVTEYFPGLDPTPGDELRCIARPDDFVDGDGWWLRREGAIVRIEGGSLFKFAPLLGKEIARMVGDSSVTLTSRGIPLAGGTAR